MNGLAEGLKALGTARLAAMGAVAACMLALLAALTLHGGGDRMALLYGDLDLREAGQIAAQLDAQHVPHQVDGGGTRILVPEDQVDRLRVALARDGIPSGGSIGYELFDRTDNLTATQFQQGINQARALEGELARTIRGIAGVRAARVHIVLPHREPFARDQQEAQASVVLTMAGAARLDREGVQAVLNLVAAAVPGLHPQNIAIVDSRGTVLARAGEPAGPAAAAQTTEELRHATELRLARAVEEMLERSLGPGRVRAEASVDMDFAQLHETEERYDPDGQVVRSTQTVTDNSKSTEQNATVSVQNNLPNADAGQTPSGNQEQRQEETTNYEIAKTVRTLVREQPQIKRISLAVMVDGVAVQENGAEVWKERPPEDLERIARIVRSAIGYDEHRGDHVEVVSMRFVGDAAPDTATPAGLLGLGIEKSDVMHLAQTALFGALALLGLIFLVRPMGARLGTMPAALEAHAAFAGGNAAMAYAGGAAALGPGGGPSAFAALEGPAGHGGASGSSALIAGLIEDDRMVNLANVEGALRASSIRRIAEMVDKHPEESLTIVRSWMQQDNPP